MSPLPCASPLRPSILCLPKLGAESGVESMFLSAKRFCVTLCVSVGTVTAFAFGPAAYAAGPASGSPLPAHAMPTRGGTHGAKPGGGGSAEVGYHGGTADGSAGTVGVEITPKVYIVYWGSQWGSGGTITNDPSGEAPLQLNFFEDLGGAMAAGGDNWSSSTTQYCQGVPKGTTDCASVNGAALVTQPSLNSVVGGTWLDDATAAPSSPTQSQLAAEAVNAAAHFGNTTPASNASVQYIIDTATGNNSSGFGTQYCAWHSSTTSSYGDIAYTNMPYVTDAGASCGAGFVTSSNGVVSATEGVTIVGGHEFAESVTDQFPSTGWTDRRGYEIGDKCAWISSGQGAAAIVDLNGGYYAVQSLWSNNFNNNSGGCVIYYNSSTDQG